MTVIIVDHEDHGVEDTVRLLEDAKYIMPQVQRTEVREVDDWDDDHPLNQPGWEDAADELFGE